ncbi:MAG: hypothetical protein J3K34DRAFT_402306 [Monoraphidium minutum]|nr:MAG: hypothetical protein J3K34DRAFT_402306 [Monoraphidium minutum]
MKRAGGALAVLLVLSLLAAAWASDDSYQREREPRQGFAWQANGRRGKAGGLRSSRQVNDVIGWDLPAKGAPSSARMSCKRAAAVLSSSQCDAAPPAAPDPFALPGAYQPYGRAWGVAYAPAEDFVPGTCSGAAFCVPQWLPPEVVYPATPCGTTLCWASLDAACPPGSMGAGQICGGDKGYAAIAAHVRLEAAAAPSPKEAAGGAAPFQLLLPRLDLGRNAVLQGAAAATEKRAVSVPAARPGQSKGGAEAAARAAAMPQCFTKCCQAASGAACTPAQQPQGGAAAAPACPPGCPLTAGLCLCRPGQPAPCPPGTKKCISSGNILCVSAGVSFGIDRCRLVRVLLASDAATPVACPLPPGAGARGAPALEAAAARKGAAG